MSIDFVFNEQYDHDEAAMMRDNNNTIDNMNEAMSRWKERHRLTMVNDLQLV